LANHELVSWSRRRNGEAIDARVMKVPTSKSATLSISQPVTATFVVRRTLPSTVIMVLGYHRR